MNNIDLLITKGNELDLIQIDGKWVTARPENHKKYMTSFRFRLKEAWNVLIGKAETLYYYKQ